MRKEMTCIACPIGCKLCIREKNGQYLVTGNRCPRGEKYAIAEITAPKRKITSTVKITGAKYSVIPVKTEHAIPKDKIFEVMQALSSVTLCAPVKRGDVVIANVANTGVDIIATRDL
jgi:CxxC motif-containing protein